MKIFVTGSAGLLGNNVVRLALAQGHRIVALVRSQTIPRALEKLDIEIVQADLSDRQAVCDAAQTCDVIVHCAALLHLGWRRVEESRIANVEGTRNVIAAAKGANAKVVHVSTVNTLAIGTPGGTTNEDSSGDGQVPCNYVVSKRGAERVSMAAADEGLDVSIVHPGFMLGPWDWKPSSGRMLLEVGKRFTPLAPSGGCSVCDVRDVAQGILSASTLGRRGRHYILAGENMSYFELWTRFSKIFNKQPPRAIMRSPARWLIGSVGDAIASVTGNEGDVNSASLKMSSQFHCYSSQRAIDELNYRPRPANEAIQSAYDWFREWGYLR